MIQGIKYFPLYIKYKEIPMENGAHMLGIKSKSINRNNMLLLPLDCKKNKNNEMDVHETEKNNSFISFFWGINNIIQI